MSDGMRFSGTAGPTGPTSERARTAVVVGGGSWSRVIVSELLRLRPALTGVHWVSRRNATAVQAAGAAEPRLTTWDSLDRFLASATADFGVVANLPIEHAPTARRLLAADIHTLVEKPVCLSRPDLTGIVDLADARGLLAGAGLEYLVAPAVAAFGRLLRYRDNVTAGGPDRIEVVWHDSPTGSQRGAARRFDPTTNVVTDLYPHVLSLLRAIYGARDIRLAACAGADGGWSARLRLTYGDLPVTVSLSRVDETDVRELRVYPGGSTEPVVLDLRGAAPRARMSGVGVDPAGTGTSTVDLTIWTASAATPVQSELELFRTGCAAPRSPCPIGLVDTLALHHAVLDAHDEMRAHRRGVLVDWVQGSAEHGRPEHRRALAEELVPELLTAGLIDQPHDPRLDHLVNAALVVTRRLAIDPFTRQRDLLAATGLSVAEMRGLNGALREADSVQAAMVEDGPARKYWQNTILPIQRSPAFTATLTDRHAYPFRVGLYPGPSCMFHCTFCGRNPDAVYRPAEVADGNRMFAEMLSTAPTDDPHRFYISGGLEPLTNPGLGELVALGADRGFLISMYTNGYLLTEKVLARQPGLWRLGTLRVSLYGPDEESAAAVTRRPKSLDRVLANVREFLRLRNARGSALRFGFNYVVLPGQAHRVLDVVELIAAIGRDVGGRGVDFLTLREDYSVPNGGFEPAERATLPGILARVEERLTDPDLAGLTVDYGYALDTMTRGLEAPALAYAGDGEIRARGFPQISVVVDPLGDVYLYREAGFLDRPGATRYVIGRVGPERGFEEVVRDFVESGRRCDQEPGDACYFDAFDHVVTLMVNQAEADAAAGLPTLDGPIRRRTASAPPPLAHPTLPPSAADLLTASALG